MQDLIDWAGVARQALWIFGLSIALAAVSHAGWWVAARGKTWRQAVARPGFQASTAAGVALCAASLAWSATRWWGRGLWVMLGLVCIWQAISALRMSIGGEP